MRLFHGAGDAGADDGLRQWRVEAVMVLPLMPLTRQVKEGGILPPPQPALGAPLLPSKQPRGVKQLIFAASRLDEAR